MAVLFYGGSAGLGEYAYQSIRYPERWARPVNLAGGDDNDEGFTTREGNHKRVKESEKSVWQKLKESSPLRALPDEEYEGIMVGKIQGLDEQIQLVDEEIQRARDRMNTHGKSTS